MSSFYYFKKAGASRREIYREISNATVADTITLWTPATGKRVAVTNMVVSAPIAGSIAFYFQDGSQLQRKVIELRGTSASSTISPVVQSLECTAVNTPLLVRVNTGATDAWSLTIEGFDVE